MSRRLHAVVVGAGPRLVLVHGSAADHATWSIQLASAALRGRFQLVAYDRRGVGGSVDLSRDEPEDVPVEQHADDLAQLIITAHPERGREAAESKGEDPVIAVGSSFGAVIVLECARRRPELLRGMVLCEPPLPASDDAPPVPDGFLADLDRRAAEAGGAAAAEMFLRMVLGDAAFEKMPLAYRTRATAQWPPLRSDCHALGAYRVRYAELGRIEVPALLLGGDRSAAYFRPTLEALAASLGRARLETLAGAGHMMHAEAHRSFHDKLLGFDAELRASP
jgi:pimeloyl-ACP methyl ester carboxylesterase